MKDLLMDNQPSGFVAGFLRFVLKVCLALIAVVCAACLLAVGLLAVVFTLIKALVTWQKPTPWVVFRQVQKYSARGQRPSNRGMNDDLTSGTNGFPSRERHRMQNPDVVDVEVREVSTHDIKG